MKFVVRQIVRLFKVFDVKNMTVYKLQLGDGPLKTPLPTPLSDKFKKKLNPLYKK